MTPEMPPEIVGEPEMTTEALLEIVGEPKGRARGGKARAASLSPERLSSIGRAGAAARWDPSISVAVCGSPDKPLRIGDIEIECYVLDDETRVLTQGSFLQALGRHPRAYGRRDIGEDQLPPIIQGKVLAEFVTDELRIRSRPVTFSLPQGGRASGYRAELLPEVCDLYLRAREAGKLPPNQMKTAQHAEILVRGLATVGIVALVDEATGFQELRERDALAQILEAFIAEELQPWVRTFPEAFYRGLFRLKGLPYPKGTVKRPAYFGHLTNDLIYRRLAPGVLEELKRQTPRDLHGRHKTQLHRRLTPDLGHPKLREHISAVVALMKASDDWDGFSASLDRALPKFRDGMVPLFDGSEGDEWGL
jgi:P63C domain